MRHPQAKLTCSFPGIGVEWQSGPPVDHCRASTYRSPARSHSPVQFTRKLVMFTGPHVKDGRRFLAHDLGHAMQGGGHVHQADGAWTQQVLPVGVAFGWFLAGLPFPLTGFVMAGQVFSGKRHAAFAVWRIRGGACRDKQVVCAGLCHQFAARDQRRGRPSPRHPPFLLSFLARSRRTCGLSQSASHRCHNTFFTLFSREILRTQRRV